MKTRIPILNPSLRGREVVDVVPLLGVEATEP